MLIGREPELAAVQEALRNSRLVSLVGLGGIGKTAVAETFARRAEDTYPGGVLLVRFAGRDELIPPILDALGEGAGELDVVEAAALALARRARVLLVLDEVEHLAHEAPLLLRLLEESEASILATSQVPLSLQSEQCVRLNPLSDDDGVRLLRARAGAQGHPVGNDDELPALVRALDGLPLAIELAAARLGVLSATEILERLDGERLSLLKAPRRGGNPRHRALQQAIAWTVSLVDDHARRTLYACALYQDEFDLASVEALLDGQPVVDSVQQLLDRSLVTARAARPKRRFALLESVRAYAREHLATSDAEELHDRHTETVLRGVDPLADPSADALRDAWPDLRAIEKRGGLRGARASLALAPLRFARAPLREHLRVLARVSEVGDPLVSLHAAILRAEALPPSEGIPLLQDLEPPDLLRGEWLRARATLCRRGGDLVTASELLEGALSAFRSAGRERAEGMALRELGVVHLHAGRRAAAERAYRAAQKVLARNAYLAEEATVLTDLAVLLLDAEGDDEAVQLLKEAQARHRAAGDVRREAIVLSNLGVASHQGGRIDEAATYFEDALQVHRRVGNLRFEAFTMGSLAGVFQERGRLSRAQDLLEQSVSVFEALGDARWEGWARARLAAVHAAAGHEELARSGFEAARTLLAESDPRWWEPALVVLQSLLPGESLPSDVAPASSARIAQRLVVASRKTPATPEPMPTLIVAADAAWFQVGDARRDIARRRVLRRLLGHLATRRSDAPGEVVTREEMLDVGWPGEKMLPRAASSRIYVAVRTLRELGLREVLVTRGGGYLLHPGVPLAFAE